MDPLYEEYLKAIQALMYQAHTLGLPRARAALHQALDVARVEGGEVPPANFVPRPPPPRAAPPQGLAVARVEVWEVPPATFVTRPPPVKFRIGPVSEQRT